MRFKRPAIIVCLCYIGGLLLGCTVPYVSSTIVWAAAVIILLMAAAFFMKRSDMAVISAICILFVLFGLMKFQYSFHVAGDGLEPLEGKDVSLTGTIINIFSDDKSKASYALAVDNSQAKVRLTIYYDDEQPSYRCGDRIMAKGEFQIPSGRRNPGGFDYKAYLKGQDIYHIMSVNSHDVSYLGSKGVHSISDLFMNIKQSLTDSVDRFMPYPENALLKGILFGYTADMPDMISEAYSATGMAHILAVSGMNVAFIPLIIYFIFKPFNSKPRFADGIAMAAIWVYAAISGLSPSVSRAAVMLSVLLGGRLLNRKADTLNSLFIAAIIILIINPLDIYNIGFMLSFAATAALLSIYKPIEGFLAGFMPKALAEICAATLASQIATLPIIAYYFNQVPILSLLANIAIIPFNGFIFLAGLALSALGVILPVVASAIAYPLYIILRSVNIFTLAMADIPWMAVKVPSPSLLLIVAYYITICAAFLWRRMSKRQVTSVAVALAFIVTMETIDIWQDNDRLKVVFLDVGQGDSIFISTPSHKNILIDGGNRIDYVDDGFDAGQSIVLPYLRHNGIMRLDLMAYSHPDSDHMGGLASIMNELRVDTVLYSIYDEEFLSSALDKGAHVVKLAQGDQIEVDDGVVLRVLYPPAQPSFDGGNNSSLVLKLEYRDFSLLLPGDIEADAENKLIQDADLESTVIKVPHHGSGTSSTDDFIAAVNSDIAVISVGNNNFGQPSDDVIRRYYDTGAQVYRTDKHGAVSIVTDGWNVSVETVIER